MTTKKMIVGRVERETDRVLLYKSPQPTNERFGEYHIIAKTNCMVRPGDTIEYEPCGVNFGWYERTLSYDNANR